MSRYVRTLPVYAYARSFTYLQAGMGAALAVIDVRDAALVATAHVLPALPRGGGAGVRAAGASRLYAGGLRPLFSSARSRLLWMLSTALKPSGEIFATPPTLDARTPSTLENFARLFAETQLPHLTSATASSSRWPPCS